MTVKVITAFAGGPTEVSEDEAAALERSGLLLDALPAAPPPEPDVEVVPRFTGVPIMVHPDEAALLRSQGLLLDPAPPVPVPDKAKAKEPAE